VNERKRYFERKRERERQRERERDEIQTDVKYILTVVDVNNVA